MDAYNGGWVIDEHWGRGGSTSGGRWVGKMTAVEEVVAGRGGGDVEVLSGGGGGVNGESESWS